MRNPFKRRKTVWVLEGITYDESAKKIETTAIYGVHKDRNMGMAHLHALGFLKGKLLGKVIDEQGIERVGAPVMYNDSGQMARAREMTLEK